MSFTDISCHSAAAILDLLFWQLTGACSPSTSGYGDGHSVQTYVSITNTERVMAILMISRSRGGHIGFMFLEIDKEPGHANTSGYTDGHRVQICVSISNTEGIITILMISRSRSGHFGIKLRGSLIALAWLMVIESKCILSQIQKELWPF